MMDPILIVGSGIAGWTVAREFRKLDRDIPIIMVTSDSGDFYSKPSLSNAFSQGRAPEQLVTSTATNLAAQKNVILYANTRVEAIDPKRRNLVTENGLIGYDTLVLATGAKPVKINVAGNASDQVLAVNSLDDFRLLHQRLTQKTSDRNCDVLIVGAGLIGCEFANDLAAAGHRVRIADMGEYPLPALLPKDAADTLRLSLESLGVSWHLGATVSSVNWNGSSSQNKNLWVSLSDGTEFSADVVITAIGLKPNTSLASAAGLSCERGILVDKYLCTSNDNVYALGDCAQYGNDLWDTDTNHSRKPSRLLPYVMPVMTASRALAQTLSGNQSAVNFPVMPITIKTPCLPLVVVSPTTGIAGRWHQDEPGVWRFLSADEQTHGFVLIGKNIAKKAQLTAVLAETDR
jgi:rubredoxin-NAD+ reductase